MIFMGCSGGNAKKENVAATIKIDVDKEYNMHKKTFVAILILSVSLLSVCGCQPRLIDPSSKMSANVYTSPVIQWADKPELYMESPALKIIKNIPSTWDETIVLKNSKIGERAAFARRKDNDWFIGIINGGKQKEYSFDLSFLGKGNYNVVTVKNVIGKPTEMDVENSTPDRTGNITVKMDAGGGFVACFKK